MIEFGETLKSAREAKGLSTSEVAEATNMLKAIVEDLEKEDFSRIVAPIYGRGFVKLYCETVGLDPAPMIEKFMDILSGKSDLKIKERPVKPQESVQIPEEKEAPVQPPETEFSKYSTPLRAEYSQSQMLGPSIWRFALLAIAAIALVCLLFTGIRALYRATATVSEEATPSPAAAEPAVANEPEKAPSKTTRKPTDIPPLYIDRIQ